jgi:hypothetical protein
MPVNLPPSSTSVRAASVTRACDLAIAWTLLTTEGRQTFRDSLAVDEPTWTRGRGWALWKTVATCWYTYEDPEDIEEFDEAKRLLEAILEE